METDRESLGCVLDLADNRAIILANERTWVFAARGRVLAVGVSSRTIAWAALN